jgi:hypothetical protein
MTILSEANQFNMKFNGLLDVADDILREIVLFWLANVKEVSCLDSAICNKFLRPSFLHHLTAVSSCMSLCGDFKHKSFSKVVYQYKLDYFEEKVLWRKRSLDQIKWNNRRGIRITYLKLKRANLALESFTATLDDLFLLEVVILKIEESMEYYGLDDVDVPGAAQVVSERHRREYNLTKLVNKCPNLKHVSFGVSPSFTVETLKMINPRILQQLWELQVDIFAYNLVEQLIVEISVHCSSLRKFHLKRESESIIDIDDELIMDLPVVQLLLSNSSMRVLIIDIDCYITNNLVTILLGGHCSLLKYVKLVGPMDEHIDMSLLASLCVNCYDRGANILIDGSLVTLLYSSTCGIFKTSVDIVLKDNQPIYMKANSPFKLNDQFVRFFSIAKLHLKAKINHLTIWGFDDMLVKTYCAARDSAKTVECINCSLVSEDGDVKLSYPRNLDSLRWSKLEEPFLVNIMEKI